MTLDKAIKPDNVGFMKEIFFQTFQKDINIWLEEVSNQVVKEQNIITF